MLLERAGIGASVKHTQVTSFEEKELLWENKILGLDTSCAFLNTVFYYNGKGFDH